MTTTDAPQTIARPGLARLLRVARSLALVLVGVALGAVFATVLARGSGEIERWHEVRPTEEFKAKRPDAALDLDAYLELEERLFAEVAAAIDQPDDFPAFSRFDPKSPTHPSRFERSWNRTWQMGPTGEVRGHALLLHGLSDAPYSMRALGQVLSNQGFRVVGLRMPGHGTAPGALAGVSREDWRAVVRLGVQATGEAAKAEGVPFVIAGYSNGAALAIDYVASAIRSDDDPVPDRLIFLSPAIAVSPAAGLAPWMLRLSRLPGLGHLGWESINVEFDPHKYNSFPMRAGAEIYHLIGEIGGQLDELEGRGDRLPPLLVFQSVVDATVPAAESLTRLLRHVHDANDGDVESELVLFDANRQAGIGDLLGPQANQLRSLVTPEQEYPFRISVVTNERTGTQLVELKSRAPESLQEEWTPLNLAWPLEVYSLSHVALPFAPEDPAYGIGVSKLGAPFPFGELELKGERGVFQIPDSLLTRLRYNPFFEVVTTKIIDFVISPEARSQSDQAPLRGVDAENGQSAETGGNGESEEAVETGEAHQANAPPSP